MIMRNCVVFSKVEIVCFGQEITKREGVQVFGIVTEKAFFLNYQLLASLK
jgi:hypothetical protein